METSRRRKMLAGAGLAAGGALVGAVLAATLSASAATSPGSSPSAPSASSTPGSAASGSAPSAPGTPAHCGMPGPQGHPGGFALSLRGTVTAVGAHTVTIKTSGGAVETYQVDSQSDIDKNGEAQLSSLAVGDAVRYSVRSGTSTIDKLHAGDEAKDAPHFGAPPGNAAT